MSTWAFEESDDGWVTLPGPAIWWPNDYNYAQHGFDTPLADNGYKAAFLMIFAAKEPAEFELISLVKDEL